MKLNDYLLILEKTAPKDLALSYDNVGLLIGTNRDIQKVLVALDCTETVADEAIALQADLVLTHHPLFFHPVNRILPDHPDTAAAYKLIQHGIGLYSAHTNLDAAEGGVNDVLLSELGFHNPLELLSDGIGRIGYYADPVPLLDVIRRCNTVFSTTVRYHGNLQKPIQKVCVVSGAGGDAVAEAALQKCDLLITGEMKHHEAIEAAFYDLPVIVAGHYESEVPVVKKWISRLQAFENDVQYYESVWEKSPLSIFEEDKS